MVVFSERLPEPAGTWRVSYLAGEAPPVEIDAGVAERGAPPTVDVDDQRIAWTGFDESSGSPRTFLRVAEQADLASERTLLDVDIDDRLLWYPQLDRDTLWYATIDPDFEASGEGDAMHIEMVDLAGRAFEPERFPEPGNAFEPNVTPDYVAWKSIEAGFSALTWGAIHVLARESAERFKIATRANHASVGSRFVAFEEFFHERLLVFDLATRQTIEIPDPLHGLRGTIGVPAVAGNLLAWSISVHGEKTVSWTRLPE